MISNSNSMVGYEEENREQVLLNENGNKEEYKTSEDKARKEQKKESKKDKGKDMAQNEEDSKKENTLEEEEAEKDKEDKFVVIDKRKGENQVGEEGNDITDYPETAAVFKVESSKIVENLSLSEKTKLLLLRRKISPVDYAQINNYLLDENTSRGIINTFILLKARLSDEDYNNVKDIASKYINIECIEEYIR